MYKVPGRGELVFLWVENKGQGTRLKNFDVGVFTIKDLREFRNSLRP
jgi:hypothetical protein